MLDPRFKTFCFMSSLVGDEQGKAIVEEHDIKSLFSMLLMCHYHLYALDEYERGIVDQRVEEDSSLDIFEMTTNISELAMDFDQ